MPFANSGLHILTGHSNKLVNIIKWLVSVSLKIVSIEDGVTLPISHPFRLGTQIWVAIQLHFYAAECTAQTAAKANFEKDTCKNSLRQELEEGKPSAWNIDY